MRTRGILCAAQVLAFASALQAQWWDLTGTPITGSEWLGADVGSSIPLSLETREPVLPINFSTDNTLRMQLLETRRSTINGFTLMKQNGFVGISPQPAFFNWPAQPGPFSRLHLVDSVNAFAGTYAQQFGYRPWMRNGITMTGNQDQCYIGQKYAGTTDANDSSDVVIQWSDNEDDSAWPTDRLRFLFTGGYNHMSPRPYGANSLEGLESFRVYIPNDTDAFVGIGDFYRATVQNGGVMVDPTERLDVLDRTVRIRDLPTVPYRTDTCERVVVVRADGRLNWRPASTITPGGGLTDCHWHMYSGTNDLVTALNGTTACPTATSKVGIGTNSILAKLHVSDEVDESGDDMGIYGTTMAWAANSSIGVMGEVKSHASSAQSIGVKGQMTNSESGYGTVGWARNTAGANSVLIGAAGYAVASGGTVNRAWGLKGDASGSIANSKYGLEASALGNGILGYGVRCYSNSSTTNYGMYASVLGTGVDYAVYGSVSQSSDWAAYFTGGMGYLGATSWTYISDETLKTDIEDYDSGALAVVAQLYPKTYRFDTDAHPDMALPEGTRYGLLAQDVEGVLPLLVDLIVRPAEYDSLGNEVTPATEFKGIKYTELTPIMLAAMKEQQAIIEGQNDRLDALEEALTACCHAADDGTRVWSPNAFAGGGNDLSIVPNPFSDATTISYALAEGGQVRLIVSTSSGKQLKVLEDVQRSAGNYTYEWNTTSLASGIYNVMLLLDGAPMVQKAVKITR